MDIKDLGEFGLIDRLTKDIKPKNDSTAYGVGDDCAVLHYPEKEVLVTSDMLMEGIHFDLVYTPLDQLGYKAAMVNISDIVAMNGTPRQMIVSIAIDKRLNVEDVEAIYRGLRQACDKFNVDVVGGDTTTSLTGLAISITCIGDADKEDIVYRNGANETDLICVSGDLGAAYMGLQILEREKTVYYQQIDEYNNKVKAAQKANDQTELAKLRALRHEVEDFQPDFAGKEYLISRQLKPEARGDVIETLRSRGIHPTAMMDVSDGLSSELFHICSQSHCGCRIYEDKIPVDYQTASTCEEFNMNLYTAALNGGEDYELLFTVPIGDHEKLNDLEGIHQIGYITKESLGLCLVTRDDKEFPLQAQGWNPLKK